MQDAKINAILAVAEELGFRVEIQHQEDEKGDQFLLIFSAHNGTGCQVMPDDTPIEAIAKLLQFISETGQVIPSPGSDFFSDRVAKLQQRCENIGCKLSLTVFCERREFDYERKLSCFKLANALHPEAHRHYRHYVYNDIDKLEQAIARDERIFAQNGATSRG